MSRLDLKVLAIIGISGLTGLAITGLVAFRTNPAPVHQHQIRFKAPQPSIEVIPFEPSQPSSRGQLLWWAGEAPIRFSGPGARGFGMKHQRRTRGFELKRPPKRLGLEGHMLDPLEVQALVSWPKDGRGLDTRFKPRK
jgi:hypothetical protein